MDKPPVPDPIREGVRSGILSALAHDFELAGARTARRLIGAGVIGVLGAIGMTLLLAGHPFGHHPPWHVAFFSAAWTGILVVALALILLGVRTPTLRVADAATVGVIALAIAGPCSLLCPDPHVLTWWNATPIGASIVGSMGAPVSAGCLGLISTFALAAIAAAVVPAPAGALHAPALAVFVALAPGLALQSAGSPAGVLVAWLASSALGSAAGVGFGRSLRQHLGPRAVG